MTARVSSFTAGPTTCSAIAAKRPPLPATSAGEEVVDPPRCAHRNVWVGDPFDPSNGVGQDREVDARGVHFLDPPVTQVVQPRRDHVGEFGVEAGITRSLLVVLAGKGVPVIGMDLRGICPAWSASTALS